MINLFTLSALLLSLAASVADAAETKIRVYFHARSTLFHGAALEHRNTSGGDTGHAWLTYEGSLNGQPIKGTWSFEPGPEADTYWAKIVDVQAGVIDETPRKDGRVYIAVEVGSKATWDRLQAFKNYWNSAGGGKAADFKGFTQNCVTFVKLSAEILGLEVPPVTQFIFPETWVRTFAELNRDRAHYIPPADSRFETPTELSQVLDIERWDHEFIQNAVRRHDLESFGQRWLRYGTDKVFKILKEVERIESSRSKQLEEQRQRLRRQGAGQAAYNDAVLQRERQSIDDLRSGKGLGIPGIGSSGIGSGDSLSGPGGPGLGAGGTSGQPGSDWCNSILVLCTSVPGKAIRPSEYHGYAAERLLTELVPGFMADRIRVPMLRLSNVETTTFYSVLDLGTLLAKERSSLSIEFVAGAAGNYAVFVTGDSLTATWDRPQPEDHDPSKPNSVKLISSSVDLASGATGRLNITFENSDKPPSLQQFAIHHDGQPVKIVTLDFISATRPSITVPLRIDNLVSGLGKAWNDPAYVICLGPAPLNYRLADASVSLASQSRHTRNCGSWATCEMVQASDADVCAAIKVQGAEVGGGIFADEPVAKAVTVNAALAATFTVARSSPRLISVAQ